MSKVYKVEVGVLLAKDDIEYNDYSGVYGQKHSFYDENTAFFTELDSAKKYDQDYDESGVDYTYGIISDLKELPEGEDIKIENNYIEDYIEVFGLDTDLLYGKENVVYSVVKTEDGLVEDFLDKDINPQSNDKGTIEESLTKEDLSSSIDTFIETIKDNTDKSEFTKVFTDGDETLKVSIKPYGFKDNITFATTIRTLDDDIVFSDIIESEEELHDILKSKLLKEDVSEEEYTHIVYLYPIRGGYETFPYKVIAEDYDSTEEIIEKAVVTALEEGHKDIVIEVSELSDEQFDELEQDDSYLYLDLTPYGWDTYFIRIDNVRVEEILKK